MAEVKIVVVEHKNQRNPIADISYSAALLYAKRGEPIKWTCESGPLAISFRDRSPLEEGIQIRSQKPSAGGIPTAEGNVRKTAEPGVYYYAVAATLNGSIYLDASCPQIIVL